MKTFALAAALIALAVPPAYAQEKGMMKKDDMKMKMEMNKKDGMMKKDKMSMKKDMKKDMMKKDAMKKDMMK